MAARALEAGALAALAGSASLYALPTLPPLWVCVLAGVAGLGLALTLRHQPVHAAVALAVAVTAWAGVVGQRALSDRLDPALEGHDLTLHGRIVGPVRTDGAQRAGGTDRARHPVRFDFAPNSSPQPSPHSSPESKEQSPDVPARVQLAWYGAVPALATGERWTLTVRLKRPHGMVNPGGFDYERWLLARGVGATGYVREWPAPVRLQAAGPGLDGWRARRLSALDAQRPPTPGASLIAALALGDTRAPAPATWELLRDTGTTHLLTVSGLHVSLVAGGVYLLVRALWPWAGRAARVVPAARLAAPAGALAALAYALVAGFAVPAQRAALVFALAMAGLWMYRTVDVARLLAVAAWAVLILDPLALLTPGFWLSFGAVAVIGWLLAGLPWPGRVRAALRVQIGLGLVLAVPVLGLFGMFSVAALPANLIAVPWVSVVCTPLALLAAVLLDVPALGAWLLGLATLSLDGLLVVLQGFARWLPAQPWPTPPFAVLALALTGTLVLAGPRGLPGRSAALVCVLPLLVWRPDRPEPGEVWAQVLDVGQGLAVVVRTTGHTLVYDTGPPLGPRLDGAQAAVLPALRAGGVRRVDVLVVSHADADHAGGLRSLVGALPVGEVWSGTPELLDGVPARACHAGQGWNFDGVAVRVLHPPAHSAGEANARSCVLYVEAGGGLLLPGDIGAAQEAALIAAGTLGPAAAVVAPHHGSRSSSSAAFIRAVQPALVLFSAGYRSRFGHPHPQVLQRYAAAGARCGCTARDGALTLRTRGVPANVNAGTWRLTAERTAARRWWRHRDGAAGCAC